MPQLIFYQKDGKLGAQIPTDLVETFSKIEGLEIRPVVGAMQPDENPRMTVQEGVRLASFINDILAQLYSKRGLPIHGERHSFLQPNSKRTIVEVMFGYSVILTVLDDPNAPRFNCLSANMDKPAENAYELITEDDIEGFKATFPLRTSDILNRLPLREDVSPDMWTLSVEALQGALGSHLASQLWGATTTPALSFRSARITDDIDGMSLRIGLRADLVVDSLSALEVLKQDPGDISNFVSVVPSAVSETTLAWRFISYRPYSEQKD